MRKLLIIAFFSLVVMAHALKPQQRAIEIKMADKDYWWGESFDLARNIKSPEARQAIRDRALADLNNSIRTFVFARIEHEESEQDGRISSLTTKSIQISSAQYLQNVRYLEYTSSKRFYVLAYLHREDYARSENESIERIHAILNTAILREKQGEEGYFTDYLKCYLYAQGITQSITHENMELSSWLRSKLMDMLNAFDISAKITGHPSSSSYPFTFETNTPQNANALLLSVPELGFHDLKMVQGRLNLFYDKEPSRQIPELQVILKPDIRDLETDPFISDGAKQLRLSVTKRIALDFSSFITVDWQHQSDGLHTVFTPIIRGISLAGVTWDLGDGSLLNAFDEPIGHHYAQAGEYEVIMLVNSELSIRKKIIVKDGASPAPIVIRENTPIITDNHDQSLVKGQDDKLRDIREMSQLLTYLKEQTRMGELVFGPVKHGTDLRTAWVVIFDRKGMRVALLEPQGDSHVDVDSKEEVAEIAKRYHGKQGFYIRYIGE